MSGDSDTKSKLSRRKFLAGSSVTVAGAAVATSGISLLSERAEAFFNMGAFWKKPVGSGQTSNGYTIGQSLRFNSVNSAYLSRTPTSVPSSTQKFTFSLWLKRANLAPGIYALLSGCDTPGGSYEEIFAFQMNSGSSDTLIWEVDGGGGAAGVAYTSALFRDPSAWYHIVLSVDTTQSVAADRCRLFVNGILNTDSNWTSKIPVAQNFNFRYLNVNGHPNQIGARYYTNGGQLFDGYLSEIFLIDGQALTPTSFGQTDSNTGQWIPKAYSGSYGTNGFYLKFADNSATTAATLGKDSSGNDNNWTPNGFATQDQVLDSPTNNFSTFNPLVQIRTASATRSISNGNLTGTSARISLSDNCSPCYSSIAIPSVGKYIVEFYCSAISGGSNFSGVGTGLDPLGSGAGSGYTALWSTDATLSWGAGDYLYVAIDGATRNVWIGKKVGASISWSGGGNPATGTTPTATDSCVGSTQFWIGGVANGSSCTANAQFDTNKFQVAAPSGFKALSTANLTAPTIKKGSQYMNAIAYTGTGASLSITGVGHQPDLIWLKMRTDAGTNNQLVDSVR
jgi:hypothetical protein